MSQTFLIFGKTSYATYLTFGDTGPATYFTFSDTGPATYLTFGLGLGNRSFGKRANRSYL